MRLQAIEKIRGGKENDRKQLFQPIYEIIRLRAERRKLPKKYLAEQLNQHTVRSPEDFASSAIKFMSDEGREIFLVACLSTQNELLSLHRCHIGTLDMNLVSPREVFKTAIMQNAASIIVAHNHVRSNCTPSPEDEVVTERLQQAGEIIGVELLDHLIVTSNQFISLKEKSYFY
ncbi:JAB domain-containing protein [Lysinibacillus sp. FSL K6-0232]|uniref:JAB domain-containing protein n=1 Tax=Lysinibacillus sp. FSL K6-0232 TaxID=2921425 RepID=UPI0030F95BEC